MGQYFGLDSNECKNLKRTSLLYIFKFSQEGSSHHHIMSESGWGSILFTIVSKTIVRTIERMILYIQYSSAVSVRKYKKTVLSTDPMHLPKAVSENF